MMLCFALTFLKFCLQESDSIGEPHCNGEMPPENIMSESESDEDSVTQESVKSTEKSHTPEKKSNSFSC